jgi:hypothetical protein
MNDRTPEGVDLLLRVLMPTPAGRHELSEPQSGLSLPQRWLLGHLNGEDSLADLVRVPGCPSADRLPRDAARLVSLGLARDVGDPGLSVLDFVPSTQHGELGLALPLEPGPPAVAPPGRAARPSSTRGSGSRATPALIGVAAVVLVGAGVAWWRSQGPAPGSGPATATAPRVEASAPVVASAEPAAPVQPAASGAQPGVAERLTPGGRADDTSPPRDSVGTGGRVSGPGLTSGASDGPASRPPIQAQAPAARVAAVPATTAAATLTNASTNLPAPAPAPAARPAPTPIEVPTPTSRPTPERSTATGVRVGANEAASGAVPAPALPAAPPPVRASAGIITPPLVASVPAPGRASNLASAAGAAPGVTPAPTASGPSLAAPSLAAGPVPALAAASGTAPSPGGQATAGAAPAYPGAATAGGSTPVASVVATPAPVRTAVAAPAIGAAASTPSAVAARPAESGSRVATASTLPPARPPVPVLVPLSTVQPVFPRTGYGLGSRSVLLVARMSIAPDGSVNQVTFDPTPGNTREFERVARRALLQWRYPAGVGARSATQQLQFSEE